MAQLSRAVTTASEAEHRGDRVGAALLVLSGAALFGTVGTAQELGPAVPTAELAAARLLLTGLLFAALAVALGHRRGLPGMLRHAPVWWAAAGQAGFNLCFLGAMQAAGVAVGTLVAIGATPILTGLISRQVSRQWLAATAVAVTGLVLLVGSRAGGQHASGAAGAGPSAVGVLLALGASLSYATYIIAGNAAGLRRLATPPFLAVAFSLSGLATLPLLLVGSPGWLLTAGGGLLVGYLALVPTVLAYNLFNRGLHGVRPSTASTLGLIEPVVAATLAVVVLGERLGWVGGLGAATILAGLLLVVRATASRTPG